MTGPDVRRDDGNILVDAADDDWKWRRRIRSNPTSHRAYRIAVGVLGLVVVVGGLAMVPLPGPGWLIVFLGLAVWASEFEWAQNLLHFARRTLSSWNAWMRQRPLWFQFLSALLTFALVLGIFWLLFKVTSVPGFLPDSVESWMTENLALD